MNQPLSRTQQIENRVDTQAVATIDATKGSILIADLMQALEVAKLMAISQVAVPKHLRDNPGACLGVVYQAIDWGMSPYAVANKSYSVNDRLGYESQMIQAVILSRAPIKDGIDFAFDGEGQTRRCTASAETLTGRKVTVTSPKLSEIKTKNSPLWTADVDQQLSYYTGRALCRRYFPQVLLGVYDRDELEGAEPMKDVSPKDSGLVTRLQASNTNQGGFDPAGVGAALAETEQPKTRYFYHPESETFVVTTDGSEPPSDGHLEEIDEARYQELQEKAKGEAGSNPEAERAGAQAFVDGEERHAPDDLAPEDAVAWLQGYDAVAKGGV